MTPGFYPASQLTNEAYHGGPGVSNSGLKLIGNKTPAHFYAQYRDPNRPRSDSTRAQMIGTALHAAALEPERFDAEYVVAPFERRNQAGAKAWFQAEADDRGRHTLIEPEHAGVLAMRRALHDHPVAGRLLADAFEFEYSAYAHDPETGVLCRLRADLVTHGGWIIDLKKCQDASPEGAAKACANYGYHHQDAFYNDVWTWAAGEPPQGFAFVFVEEQYPHAVGVYWLADEDRERGRREYRRNLQTYIHCDQHNVWPGYSPQAETLELPYWARKRIDESLFDMEETL